MPGINVLKFLDLVFIIPSGIPRDDANVLALALYRKGSPCRWR